MRMCKKCGGPVDVGYVCKKCRNAASLAWYYDNKEKSNSRSRATRPRRIENKATIVGERGGSCELCGYGRHLCSLDFHHVTSKSFCLYQANMYNVDRARIESLKCVLLCANCHREVHSGAVEMPRSLLDAAYTRYGEWILSDVKNKDDGGTNNPNP
jgi:hypothetical protein